MKRIKCPDCKGTGFIGNSCCRRCEGSMSIEQPVTKITIDFLYKHHACDPAQDRFIRLFGDSAEINAENIKRWREASIREGYPGQDPGWIIWCAFHAAKLHRDSFTEHVNGDFCYKGQKDFKQATFHVGQEYSPERCAEAIRQVLSTTVGRAACPRKEIKMKAMDLKPHDVLTIGEDTCVIDRVEHFDIPVEMLSTHEIPSGFVHVICYMTRGKDGRVVIAVMPASLELNDKVWGPGVEDNDE